jgi:hypothetical protein
MCGTAGLFLGCEAALTCPLQRLRTPQPGESADPEYQSAFLTWDTKATVRSAPRRVLESPPPPEPFPAELVPVFRHPLVKALRASGRRFLLAQHLFRYLDFTTQLELVVVNDTLVRLALQPAYGLTEPMRLDALRMVCDESYHALFSMDMKLQIADAYGIAAPADSRAWFLARIDRLLAETDASLREVGRLLFVTVSETLISASLAEHARGTDGPAAVRNLLQDHAVDEGRHHAFFAAFTRHLWACLDRSERRWAGRLIPQLIDIFLSVDVVAIEADLRVAGLSPDEAHQVAEETFLGADVVAQKRQAASRTIRYFDELDAFRDDEAQASLIGYGLADTS